MNGLVTFHLWLLSCWATGASFVRGESVDYRLPKTVIPTRYNVTLEPHLYSDPPSFTGSISIETLAAVSTKNITLHAKNLNLSRDNTVVLDQRGEELPQDEPTWVDETDFYIINLKTAVEAGREYTIVASTYTGLLNSDNAGFYLAKYVDGQNEEHRLATTQFQSVGARRTYPCFDEPAFKAAYNVKIVHPSGYTSISNQEKVSEALVDEYLETPLTTSYAMAFVVSEFEWVAEGRLGVFARPEAIREDLADYALGVSADFLGILEDYLRTEYPLPKLDQIAIPDEYFAPGAMENWGLITYRETYLLYSDRRSTTEELQKATTTIAHEIAHQWFGDLVTLEWWNYLWLNEGFATYFQYYVISLLDPSWRMMDQFVTAALQYSLKNDVSDSTQPINYATTPPGGGPPGWVAYQKGAALLRMIESVLGPDIFRNSLIRYLRERQFGTAKSEDLYRSLQTTVTEENANHLIGNFTVSEMMTAWEFQKGYPLIEATRNYDNKSLRIRQDKFTPNASSEPVVLWHVPINFACDDERSNFSDTSAEIWLTQKEITRLDPCDGGSWLLLNKRQTGFYRVNYDEENWQRIGSYLSGDDFARIDVLNRANLVDDALNLAKFGYLPYGTALSLTSYLARETDYIPWYPFFSEIASLNYNLAAADCYAEFKRYVFDLARNLYSQLGFEQKIDDSHVDKLNRNNLLKNLCFMEHEECTSQSRGEFLRWRAGEIPAVTPNLQEAVFCAAMRSADESQWDFLYGEYSVSSHYHYTYRLRVLNGLGCSKNESILNKYINAIVDANSSIEESHRSTAFQSIFTSGEFGLNFAFDYIANNLSEFTTAFSNSEAIINNLAARFTSRSQLNRLVLLAEENGLSSKLETAIESAKTNVRWVEDYVESISDWLAKTGGKI